MDIFSLRKTKDKSLIRYSSTTKVLHKLESCLLKKQITRLIESPRSPRDQAQHETGRRFTRKDHLEKRGRHM